MNDFVGMEELLDDFLMEASEMLSDVDGKLIDLEKSPGDTGLLNDIFRGFHTIKGGAGFLNATELVSLCHLTENLFDKLRNKELELDADIMDVIFAATSEVRRMFDTLQQSRQPAAAPDDILNSLKRALNGESPQPAATDSPPASSPEIKTDLLDDEKSNESQDQQNKGANTLDDADWHKLYDALTGNDILDQVGVERDENKIKKEVSEEKSTREAFGRRASDVPGQTVGRRDGDMPVKEVKETTIRVDTARLDQVLNLSGEIGLTKNRLMHLRSILLQDGDKSALAHDMDQAITQLDMLVVNLQNAVMKTRMQPIGRLFKKYPRLARDLARSLGKNVELVLRGEETEMDKTMIEDLNDPLVHLVRNAVDHGVETTEGRIAAGKPEKSVVELSAMQEGDHILIQIVDDGRGMRPEAIRGKAIDKGLISADVANTLDEGQCLELVFLPGFSTKQEVSSISGRGVGMDVVKTNIEKLNGSIGINSEPGVGSVFTISLPLTLAILPVLLLTLAGQPFAVPLSMVREIISISPENVKQVSGKSTMVVRGEVLPVLSLASLIGWESDVEPEVGVLMQIGNTNFILSADGFAGHDDVVIKSLDTFRPKGVAGVTMSSDGDIILILDVKELLEDLRMH